MRSLALCTHALRPRLHAAAAAAEAAAASVDALDGATEWTHFSQAAGRLLHRAVEPPPPPPPNMASVVRIGAVGRRVPSLLGSASWSVALPLS